MSAIAIVGLGCRFAGAEDPTAFWRLVREGRDAFGPVPPDRWSAEMFLTDSARDMDRTTAPAGGFLDDVRSFPALALGIPPRRVEVMDPQQRMTLEIALQALLDAGLRPGDVQGRAGVYVGVTAHEYRTIQGARTVALMMADGQLGDAPSTPEVRAALAAAVERVVPPRPFSAPGVLGNMTAAAVAQELDLHGPAYTVDAACASAMVAVHDAVSHLRTGQIDLALAGGAYLQLNPEHYVAFSRIGAMSNAGRCRPFDAAADGFVQGDGVGLVVLKRLEDAERDGDRVYAVLEGVAVNNDGRGDGPMAPVRSGQADVLRQAWKDAGAAIARATLIETHGTGTDVGDVTEVGALRDVLGEALAELGAEAPALALASVKANIGHTMSTAGVAGLIKAALAVHHATLPPMAGFERPKEALALGSDSLWVPTVATAWEDPERWTGVSSFGFGGTNGHAVLRAPHAASVDVPAQPELVTLSAPTADDLAVVARQLAAALRDDAQATVAGVARALAVHPAQAVRAALVVDDLAGLLAGLDAIADGAPLPDGVVVGDPVEAPPRVGFLFPGQGAQRLGMLRDVARRFPRIAATLADLEHALDGQLDAPLTHLMWPEERGLTRDDPQAAAQLTATEHCQPAMYAAGVALTRLLDDVGVRPDVVAGHSLGELAAFTVAGAWSSGDGARYVARRGRAMADLPGDHGAMAALRAPEAEVSALLADGAVVANLNHPRQTVVSGTTAGVEATLAAAEAAGVEATRLDVSHAFHSPLLAELDGDAWLEGLTLRDPAVPVASAITGRRETTADGVRAVCMDHATSAVRFTDALEACVAGDDGVDLLLQVGAGGPLASFARGTVGGRVRAVLTLAPRDDADGGRGLLATLGQLWCLGVDVDVRGIAAEAPLATVPPPRLPREVYWAVKDKPSRRLRIPDAAPARPAPKADDANEANEADVVSLRPAPQAADAPAGDDVLGRVTAIVAKVSAYPVNAVKPSMTLVDDLGFDSLMVGDLSGALAEAFPGVGALPQALLLDKPTVQVLVDWVRAGGSAAEDDVDDDAPLSSWTFGWTAAPLPELPPRFPTPARVVVTGPGREAARAAGLTVLDHEEAAATDADALVWIGPSRLPGLADVLDGAMAWPDLADELLRLVAAHDRRGRHPHVLAVTPEALPWSEGTAGALRALAREWPEVAVKHVLTDEIDAFLPHLRTELCSADRSVDVRWAEGERAVRGLTPVEDAAGEPLTADDTVLITGGTRGIGLSLGLRLAGTGARVVLLGRRAPDGEDAAAVAAFPNVDVRLADVLEPAALTAALDGLTVTHLVHAAGVLADGAVGEVDPADGELAREVKVDGWLNAVAACGESLRVAVGVGSWAGALGNRHQTHYAAANALLSALADAAPDGLRAAVAAFGPWTGSAMVETIPEAVQKAMRAEGVDFVGPQAGLDVLEGLLRTGEGARVVGRRLPASLRTVEVPVSLSRATDPYLLDHALDGLPVLPLAAANDLLAWAADPEGEAALTLRDLTLYRGVVLRDEAPVRLLVRLDGDRARLLGADGTLHYEARLDTVPDDLAVPAPATGGTAPEVGLDAFYDGLTFHGPLLHGITALGGVADDHVHGTVRVTRPAAWTPDTGREAFALDPLAVDSAMQLAAIVAWNRYRRGGTPIGVGATHRLRPLPAEGTLTAEAWFDPTHEPESDRFTATIVLRDDEGPVLVLEDVVAELRVVEGKETEAAWTPPPEATDVTAWPEVRDLGMRVDGVTAMGLQNPYFHVHEGTARDTTRVGERELVHFSGYNYLGLSGDPRVLEQVRDAVDRYGTSVSASRVASGERPFHGQLERLLARCQGAEDALLFTAGHATNVTTVGHLFGPEDLVLHDELIHDSVLQGIKLSGAARRGFRHDDPAHLEAQLTELRRHYRRCLIVVEGVYSMDGDLCQLPAYVDLKKRFGCLLMVDEAHSFGVVGATGCGVGEHYGLDGREVDLWMGTLSKSLASCGGWIAGSKDLIRYLRYTAPGFVYSAGLTPANGVAALAALELMLAEPERVQKLQANGRFFHEACVRHGLDTGPALGGSAVIPVVTGNSYHALVLSERLQAQGINVQPIVYPAVADDAARLRFFLSSLHSEAQLARTASVVAATLQDIRTEFPAA